MLFGGFHRSFRDDVTAAEKARLLHARWLTRALRDPRRAFPMIPLRRVSDGGFDALMSDAGGRAWARSWWESTLSSPDLDL